MKRLILCLLLWPLLASCKMTEPEYYDAGYYHSIPPRSEIYGFDERRRDYRHSRHKVIVAPKKVVVVPKKVIVVPKKVIVVPKKVIVVPKGNAHGHHDTHRKPAVVVVKPRHSHKRVEVKRNGHIVEHR